MHRHDYKSTFMQSTTWHHALAVMHHHSHPSHLTNSHPCKAHRCIVSPHPCKLNSTARTRAHAPLPRQRKQRAHRQQRAHEHDQQQQQLLLGSWAVLRWQPGLKAAITALSCAAGPCIELTPLSCTAYPRTELTALRGWLSRRFSSQTVTCTMEGTGSMSNVVLRHHDQHSVIWSKGPSLGAPNSDQSISVMFWASVIDSQRDQAKGHVQSNRPCTDMDKHVNCSTWTDLSSTAHVGDEFS
eukprot:scaffold183123_cov23-Tisochrysis_lutea.AAC.1